MSLLAAAAILAASPLGLTLEVRSPQTAVLVGEPVKVVVTWRATNTLKEQIFPENEEFSNWSVIWRVSDGRTEREYREAARSIDERIEPIVMLKRGEEVVRNLVLIQCCQLSGGDGLERFLFPTKGKYRLRAIYSKHQHWVESNELSFTVSDPTPDERDVLDAVRRHPTMLTLRGDADVQAMGKALIAKHPKSRYLRRARLQAIETKANAVHNQYDPDTGDSMLHLDKAAIRGFRTGKYRDLAEDILADSSWGPFEEEALILADTLAQASGDVAVQEKARKELFERHPHSPAVKRIKDDEAEDAEDDDEASEPKKPSPKPKQ